MLSVNIPAYANGYNVEHINCTELPIASASGSFYYDNYYFYSFYNSLLKNWTYNTSDEFTESKNSILKKIGLILIKNTITDENDLIDCIHQKLRKKAPVLMMAKYKYMFHANQYNQADYNSSHVILISDYDPDRSVIIIRDFIHQRQANWPLVKGDLFARLPMDKRMLFDIWKPSNNDYHKECPEMYSTVFSLEQNGISSIRSYADLVDDWLTNYLPQGSKMASFINNFNKNRHQYNKNQVIKLIRRSYYMPFRIIFDITERMLIQKGARERDLDNLWKLKTAFMDLRYDIMNKLADTLDSGAGFTPSEAGGFVTGIESMDDRLITTVTGLYNQVRDPDVSGIKDELVDCALTSQVIADSESRPALFAIRSFEDAWVSGWADTVHWIQFNLDQTYSIKKIVITHFGDRDLNTRDFVIQTSPDGSVWVNRNTVKGNDKDCSVHEFEAVTASKVRLMISHPCLNDGIARIRKVEIWGVKA